ncbi:hypothetical protein IW262DRAFT_812123 [Armillaria fumosa]|nr:hypothetical protein IW262DRAFT_812123 [Armillaria fumosa]
MTGGLADKLQYIILRCKKLIFCIGRLVHLQQFFSVSYCDCYACRFSLHSLLLKFVAPTHWSEITIGAVVSVKMGSDAEGVLIQYFYQFGCSNINRVASFRIPGGMQMITANRSHYGTVLDGYLITEG